MRTGRCTFAELFVNRHVEQLVIPEIQRDYVWGKPQVEALLASILGNFHRWTKESAEPTLQVVARDTLEAVGDAVRADFAAFFANRNHSTNIGFIYAYCDPDLPGQYFLIDGQQRLTTVYLILLAVSSEKADLTERFRTRYCLVDSTASADEAVPRTKLDYRLREHTSDFLRRFVVSMLAGRSMEDFRQESWYSTRHEADPTNRQILENYKALKHLLAVGLQEEHLPGLFRYLEDLVHFWYFDSNESAQGEELYLYLNARGETIAENENLKVRLLRGIDGSSEKGKWGREWEEWQDFFWQNRANGLPTNLRNPNADRGFNSFLSSIENLEKLRTKSEAVDLDFERIHEYVSVLQLLGELRESLKKRYRYADWIDRWYDELWKSFNYPLATDWGISLDDTTKSTEHNRMVLVWGSLLCLWEAIEGHDEAKSSIDFAEDVFRAIRVFYLRFHNYSRAVKRLPDVVRGLLAGDLDVLGKDEYANEERRKAVFLQGKPDVERRLLEAVIWEIEDHPLNLDGRNVGGTNLSHLVNLTPETTLVGLERVRDRFLAIFPPGKTASKAQPLARALLYYGSFWDQVSPWYYDNYNLGNWRLTIRGGGSAESGTTGKYTFKAFFEEFVISDASIEDFLDSKHGSIAVDPVKETDLRKSLIWYSEQLGDQFLRYGMHIARTYDRRDGNFPLIYSLWNISRYFRGDNIRCLADLLERTDPRPEQAAPGIPKPV